MATLVSVPTIRKPCDVSSLLMRSSISSPAVTSILEGVKANRSALTLMTRRSCCSGIGAAASETMKARTPQAAVMVRTLEPPSQADVETVRSFDEPASIALPDVIHFHRHVGIGVIRRPDDPGVPIELLEMQESVRHPELRIEILVSNECHQIAGRS